MAAIHQHLRLRPQAQILLRVPWLTSKSSRFFSQIGQQMDVNKFPSALWHMAPQVRAALEEQKPVVALESALITHGLAHPLNLEVALRLQEIVRREGAVPATVGLMAGKIRVGLTDAELEEMARPGNGAQKVSLRDLAACLVQKRIGGTTVAATMWIAHRAGIKVFGTGGIGGVHRGAEQTMDISADLVQLGRSPVAVVCAGVKSILDIAKTLEFLETQSVPVVVLDRQPQFPGFFSSRTKLKAPHCTDSLEELADMLISSQRLGLQSGTLVACPLPGEHSAQGQLIEEATQKSLAEAVESDIQGKAVTPFVLRRVAEMTGNESVRLNICLLENNVKMAAQLAVLYSTKMRKNGERHVGQQGHSCQQREFRRFTSDSEAKFPSKSKSDNKDGHQIPLAEVKRRPKVVCVGASIVDFEVLPPKEDGVTLQHTSSSSSAPAIGGFYLPAQIVQRPGGVARNHADALSRLGCDVVLLSALGVDQQGQPDPGALFLMQSGTHMDWSQVLRSANQPTATSIGLGMFDVGGGPGISHGFKSVDGLMALMDRKFIDSKAAIIAEADFVLLDANLTSETIRRIQHWANKSGTKIWFEPTNALEVPKLFAALGTNALAEIDIISPNLAELHAIVANFSEKAKIECELFLTGLEEGLSSSPDSLQGWLLKAKIPECLCPKSQLLITCDRRGVFLIRRSNSAEMSIAYSAGPQIDASQIVSVSGAGDCFNCGFLYAQLIGISDGISLEIANECARQSLLSAEAVPNSINEELLNKWTK